MWMRPFQVIYIKWSNLCYYRNDLAQAEEYLIKAIDLCQQSGYTLNLYYAKIYLAQLRLVQGQVEVALNTIQEVEQVVRQNQHNAYDIEIEAYKTWIQARVGNQDAAAAWLNSIDLRIGERIGYWRGIQCVQAAHVMLDLDQVDRVLDFLPRLERAAKNGGSLPNRIEALVMQAVVCQKKGDTGQALKFLEKALVLSAPEKFKQVFLNEGPLMVDLLDKLLIRKIEPAFLQELLAAFLIMEQGQVWPKEAGSPESILIESLSSREIEVLQLVAEGLTNPEIAARVYISLNTVKVHSRNIYGKLRVNNRTQAVIRGKDLGILTSN
jgi:LuxR family maltose regulon positive regulatory protein